MNCFIYIHAIISKKYFLDMLKKTSGRIVNVSSAAGQMFSLQTEDLKDLNQFVGRQKQYHRTKLCNILYTIELSGRLHGTGVTTYSLHPGVVLTDFFRELSPFLKMLAEFILSTFFKVCI